MKKKTQPLLTRKCCDCGNAFLTRWAATRRCDECHGTRYVAPPKLRSCSECTAPFTVTSRSTLCPSCRSNRNRAGKRSRSSKVRKRPQGHTESVVTSYRTPLTRKCCDCGKQFGTLWAEKRRCDECKAKHLAEYKREWKQKNRERSRTYKREYERRARLDHRNKLLATMRSRVATAPQSATPAPQNAAHPRSVRTAEIGFEPVFSPLFRIRAPWHAAC